MVAVVNTRVCSRCACGNADQYAVADIAPLRETKTEASSILAKTTAFGLEPTRKMITYSAIFLCEECYGSVL